MKNRIANKFQQKCQSGFSLIEILIAMFVLSVGMLGVGAMLLQSIRFNHDSNIRGQALFLAMDMAERVRNNQSANPADAYFYGGITGLEVNPNCIELPAGCTAAQLRDYDGFTWGQMIRDRLPGGTGSVQMLNGAAPDIMTITISWQEQDDNTADGTVVKNLTYEILPNLLNPGRVNAGP